MSPLKPFLKLRLRVTCRVKIKSLNIIDKPLSNDATGVTKTCFCEDCPRNGFNGVGQNTTALATATLTLTSAE
jgi:hypothetical protein